MTAGWNKGIPATEARKEKVSNALRGRKLSEKNKQNIGRANRGKIRTQEVKNRISATLKSKGMRPPMTRLMGEKNPAWKGGVSFKRRTIRNTREYRLWRAAVLERDGYACIWGGKAHGERLEADHIKPISIFPELRFAIDNGRTLCRECHKLTETYAGKILRQKKHEN